MGISKVSEEPHGLSVSGLRKIRILSGNPLMVPPSAEILSF